jgi:hypothetical protein
VKSIGIVFFGISCLAKFDRHPTSKTNQSSTLRVHHTKMSDPRLWYEILGRLDINNSPQIPPLPLELWQKILELLGIKEAIAISKAHPRFFGAFIESKQGIRFHNTINSFIRSNAKDLPVGPLASIIRYVSRRSHRPSLEFSGLISWLARRFQPVLSSSIVINTKLFEDISSTIALKDRGFFSVSSSLSNLVVEMKAKDESSCSISWILLYRASLSNYRAAEFHRACDGMGKCVVVIKAENGRIAIAYNEDGFTSVYESTSPNLNGFIACVDQNGRCGEVYHRNDSEAGVYSHPSFGPMFGNDENCDLAISNRCHQNEFSWSELGSSYGAPGYVYKYALVGSSWFPVVDYEVFKFLID